MKIEIPNRNSYISASVDYNGNLVLELEDNINVLEAILEAVYNEMNTEDFIKTLDYDQIAEISEYFETIRIKK